MFSHKIDTMKFRVIDTFIDVFLAKMACHARNNLLIIRYYVCIYSWEFFVHAVIGLTRVALQWTNHVKTTTLSKSPTIMKCLLGLG